MGYAKCISGEVLMKMSRKKNGNGYHNGASEIDSDSTRKDIRKQNNMPKQNGTYRTPQREDYRETEYQKWIRALARSRNAEPEVKKAPEKWGIILIASAPLFTLIFFHSIIATLENLIF